MSSVMKRLIPVGYPATYNSGISDARAFKFIGSNVMHRPVNYPDGNRVTAACGAWGYVAESDVRLIQWASGYVGEAECARCWQ